VTAPLGPRTPRTHIPTGIGPKQRQRATAGAHLRDVTSNRVRVRVRDVRYNGEGNPAAGETMIETANSIPVADLMAESVRRLRASLQAERIYLFGSRARDEAHEDSDYDFLVVVRDSPLPRYKRDQQVSRAVCRRGIANDVLIFTREELERGWPSLRRCPLLWRDGRLLYP